MNKKFLILFCIFSLAVFSACDKKPATADKTASAQPEVKKGVAPVADNEIAVIEMEEAAYGTIKIELYSNIAPKAVARFKELANEGFFSGTTFHRINDSVIQGGDPLSKDDNPANDGTGKSDKPNVDAELSDIPYDTGIVGAARGPDFNSANSQFFITLRRQSGFDNKYTIFGKVIDGMSYAKTIAGAPKNGERPLEDIKIKQVTIQPK
ncbi:MAG: peptidylprolyl isomerase [Pyrinomonadaceae bacterium]